MEILRNRGQPFLLTIICIRTIILHKESDKRHVYKFVHKNVVWTLRCHCQAHKVSKEILQRVQPCLRRILKIPCKRAGFHDHQRESIQIRTGAEKLPVNSHTVRLLLAQLNHFMCCENTCMWRYRADLNQVCYLKFIASHTPIWIVPVFRHLVVTVCSISVFDLCLIWIT